MQKVNLKVLYDLGKALSTISDIKEGDKQIDTWSTINHATLSLEKFLSEIKNVPMPKSRETAKNLYAFAKPLSKELFKAMEDNRNDTLTLEDHWKLIELRTSFEEELDHEVRIVNVFAIPDRDNYSITGLIDHGENVLPEGVRQAVTSFVRNEFHEAGKCIAFSLPTAAGIHLLRAVESVLRQYYDVISGGTPRPKKGNRRGGAMSFYINEVERLGADPKAISALNQIKDLHRNPNMHPEDVMDMDEAIFLLGVVKSAIGWMVSDMKKRETNLPPP